MVKATENCIGHLMAKGINAADSVVRNPTVTLNTGYWQSLKIDCTHQVDTSSSNSVIWFESLMTYMDMTETELDAILTESEDDNFLFDSIDCVVQAIKSIRFNWPQCPIQMLQTYLHAKGLGLEVLENNPMLFTAFKQKLYKEFQNSFFWYCPLLEYVTIHNFQWHT